MCYTQFGLPTIPLSLDYQLLYIAWDTNYNFELGLPRSQSILITNPHKELRILSTTIIWDYHPPCYTRTTNYQLPASQTHSSGSPTNHLVKGLSAPVRGGTGQQGRPLLALGLPHCPVPDGHVWSAAVAFWLRIKLRQLGGRVLWSGPLVLISVAG